MQKNEGAIAWLFQRLSAVALLFLLGGHFGLPKETLVALVNDIGLLLFGLFHALNGTNNVLQDYGIGTHGKRFASNALLIVGLVLTVLGGYALVLFP